ncbi:dephospho-CoA kinase [Polaribacter reichenbachii]|uniref:Dephospho-CoA kinase n=1 Tax=Polaribacter reichenbachii TaxID=996801 RepID=A0A1B8U4I6_9FLAO|nr:dephospho-CoA kinase [Polaribacter reichenbachii]APZ47530.1 dephospho-CoA kinase [Polaribacter reichenbachii]AUC18169.1 dephospho-CoA kinase [Polaribacter reichenbachii]OBY66780.1 dephospho-CoA kinase [Polaribacter reichenbachii]
MKIVGLTGGIGSGKTTVAKFFAENNNVAIYIADVEAKKLMNSSGIIKQKLINNFGENSYKDNILNRKYIADIVFKDKEKLSELNAIVHPEVKKHFQEFVNKNNDKDYIIYENAILFESKSSLNCDIIITVYADLDTKINRVIARDSSTKKEVLNRMKNQWNDQKKMFQSNYIIYNEKLDDTKSQVSKIHSILTLNT